MSNELLEAALAYAARGWPIFPCRADKTPYTSRGVLDATTDKGKIEGWWTTWPRANVGLDVGGAGLVVLDLDPGYSPDELVRAIGDLPNTGLRAKTPRGGTHLFFALAPGEVVSPSASKLAAHVDVRSFHSYVLLAPSRTAAGPYVWEGDPLAKPAYRTDLLVERANSHREKHRDRDNWIIEQDLPENVALAVEWLRRDAKVAIQGQGGDDMAYRTAAAMKSHGLSEATAFDLMWEHWNPRCVPPWSADEVGHFEAKVRNGYSYNTSPPGNMTPAYRVARSRQMFQPVAVDLPSGREFTAGRFRFVDRAGIEHVPPPEWIVPGLLMADSTAIVYGVHGSYKTFVALDVALTIATGAPAFPWQGPWSEVNGPGPVLFVAGEGRGSMLKRLRAWEQTHHAGAKVENFVLADPVPLIGEGGPENAGWEPFVDGALSLSPDGYRLVVVDTVGRAMQGVNENAQEYASAYTRFIDYLRYELGCTVLSIHHAGKDDQLRGSSVFAADADTIVRVTRGAADRFALLSMEKQKDAEAWERPLVVELREVEMGDQKSLAVVRHEEDRRPAVTASGVQATAAIAEARHQIVLRELDRHVGAVLGSNPSRSWSTRDLASAVAMRHGVDVSSKTLQNTHLVDLREQKDTLANRCYDPQKKVWQFRE